MAGRDFAVRVLGPVALEASGRLFVLPGARQQALLARLLVAGGAPVGPWQLRHDVWAGRHKSDAALRVAVSRLRNALADAGAPDAITRTSDGYAIDRGGLNVDADRFTASVADAHRAARTDPPRAVELATGALALWRGQPFGELRDEVFLLGEAEHLSSVWRDVVEVRLTALLALGTDGLVPELEAAVAESPLRERLTGLLMVALYRNGRQAEALAAYRRLETNLRDDLGLSPGDELRQLDRRILQHDPELLHPEPPVVAVVHTVAPAGDDARRAAVGRARSAQALARAGVVEESLRLVASAVEAARQLDDSTLAKCLVVGAQTSALAGRSAAASAALREAIGLARRAGDGAALASAALVRFGFGLADDDDLLAELMEPLELLRRDAGERIDLLCAAMHQVALTGDPAGAARLLAQAEAIAIELGDARSRALVLAGQAVLAGVRTVPIDALCTLASVALEAAETSGDPTLLVAALHGAVRAAMEQGDLVAFDAAAARLETVATASLFPFAVVRIGLLDVSSRLARGDLAGLEERVAAVEATGESVGVGSSRNTTQGQRGLLALERAQFDALATLAGALAVDRGPGWSAAHALALAETGRHRDGADLVGRVLETADEGGLPKVAPDELDLVAMLAAEVAFLARDRRLAACVRQRLCARSGRFVVVAHATLTLGPVDRALGLLALVIGDDADAVVQLRQAVAQASQFPLWRARSEVGLALALAARDGCGDAAEAACLLDGVRSSAVADSDRGGSAWLAAQVRRAAHDLALTPA